MSDLTREEKIKCLSRWCISHACNSKHCRIYDLCQQIPTVDWPKQTDKVIDNIYEALWEGSSHSPVVIDKTCEEELRQDLKKEYEVFSNGFSVPISKELSQKIDKVINDQTAKADAGKAEIRLVPMEIVWAIAWIRMYGNRKYGDPENWKLVEPERYRDALMRHLLAYISDPKSVDEESGYPHLWHAACNMAFLMHFDYGEEVLHDPNKTV